MTALTSFVNRELCDTLSLESGNWIVMRRELPAFRELPGVELLARALSELPRHFRYARAPEGVVLLAENHAGDTEEELFCAEDRLLDWRNESPLQGGALPVDESIETVLDDLAVKIPTLAWSRREKRLVVPAGALSPLEVEIRPVPGGVKAEALLAVLDEAPAVVYSALGEFLTRAQSALRFARAEIDGANVRIVSQASADALDVELGLALAGVAAGCRRFSREAAALVRPELANAYLQTVAIGTAGSRHGC